MLLYWQSWLEVNQFLSQLHVARIVYFYLMCTGVFASMYVCRLCMPSAHRGQKKVSHSSGTGATEGYEPPYGYWEWNLGSLEDQSMLLTVKPSL